MARPRRPVAIVTGAARGIGQAAAERLAHDGFHVILVDRDAAAGQALRHRLSSADLKAGFVCADVTREAEFAQAVALAREAGGVDALVNNAGVTHFSSFLDIDRDEWNGIVSTCLGSVFSCVHQVLPEMVAAGHGAIVNVASIHGRVAAPGLPAYTAAKAGIVGLTRQLAVEYGPAGVRCNVVSPGFIWTPATEAAVEGLDDLRWVEEATPCRRIGEPSDVAGAVSYLVSDEASFVNGAEIVVDGGASLVLASGVLRAEPRRRQGLAALAPTAGVRRRR